MAFFLVVAGAFAFAVFEPIQVLPRYRLAPGYSLVDQHGATINSEQTRGGLTLYSFAPTDCGSECESAHATMAEVAQRVGAEVNLGSVPFRQITIALDSDPTSADLQAAAAESGADGTLWSWAGGSTSQVDNIVSLGFGVFYQPQGQEQSIEFDSRFVLVDGGGVIRGDYRYQTIASDADKLINHLNILADEIRNAHGATAVAYEAAHLFLCYP